MPKKQTPKKPNLCPKHFFVTNEYNRLTNKAECFYCNQLVTIEQVNERGQVLLKSHVNKNSKN